MKRPSASKPRKRKKRRTPLQALWTSVKVESCANGLMIVTPAQPWVGLSIWTPEHGGGPGIFTRMRAARQLQRFINGHLKGYK